MSLPSRSTNPVTPTSPTCIAAAAGVLAWLRVDSATDLLTTTAWRVRRNRSYSSSVPRISIYGSGVEDRVMIHEEAWTEPAYDDSTWEAAAWWRRLAVFRGPGWLYATSPCWRSAN